MCVYTYIYIYIYIHMYTSLKSIPILSLTITPPRALEVPTYTCTTQKPEDPHESGGPEHLLSTPSLPELEAQGSLVRGFAKGMLPGVLLWESIKQPPTGDFAVSRHFSCGAVGLSMGPRWGC